VKEFRDADDSIRQDLEAARERFSGQGAKRLAGIVSNKPKDRSARLALVEEQAGAADRSQFDRIKASSSDSRRTLAREFAKTVLSIGKRFEAHVAGIAVASWKSDQDECGDVGIPPVPSAPTLAIASTWRIHRELRAAATNPRSPGPDSIRELIGIWTTQALGASVKPAPVGPLSPALDGQPPPLSPSDPSASDPSGGDEISPAPV
jgi:hypothetical protein